MAKIIGVDLKDRVFRIEGAGNARMDDLPGARVGTNVELVNEVWRIVGDGKACGT